MKKVYIDVTNAETPAELHAQLARALDFPAYYGNNLDALYDCLTEIGEDTGIGIYGPPREEMAEFCARLKRVFGDVERENAHLCVFMFDDVAGLRAGEVPPRGWIGEAMIDDLFSEEDAEMMGQYGFAEGEDDEDRL